MRTKYSGVRFFLKTVLLGGSLGIALSACASDSADDPSRNCTDEARAGLNVRVIDGKTGEPMCGGQVSAADGAYSETLADHSGNRNGCIYAGAWERAGTYRVSASKEGYVTKSVDVVVTTEPECGHVEGQIVELILSPE